MTETNSTTDTPTQADTTSPAGAQNTAHSTAQTGATAEAVDTAARIAKLEADLAAQKDQLLRALAETENVRRRAEREREDTAKYAVSKFAKDLLAVADNLRRAVESVPAETREKDQAVNNLLTGVEATERQLIAAFDKANIQKMDALGKPADPNFHQIMAEVEDPSKLPGTVIQVYQPGYTIQGRLLREAMVVVAKGGAAAAKVDTSA